MRVKRWLIALLVGITLIALSIAFVLRELYDSGFHFPTWAYYITLQFWPRWVRALILALLGLGCVLFALRHLSANLLSALPAANRPASFADLVYRQRREQTDPRVVAIGGGHGLSTLLSGLKQHTANITAIVNVADDGGSSGRLRREFGVLPPGDIRRCLAALAEEESLMAQLFEYRFDQGEGLRGHTFGNLFITVLDDITGSFDEAVKSASNILALRGRVIPPTLEDVTLAAELVAPEGETVRLIWGESSISKGGHPIRRVFLDPPNPPAYPDAVKAIMEADLVVFGPGSLYTSILPVLLVDEIRTALQRSPALCVYVCNVATEPGETDQFGVRAHLHALREHVGMRCIDLVLANNNTRPANNFAPEWQGRTQIVPLDTRELSEWPIVAADIINPANPLRHDPRKLARELMRLLRQHQAINM
jgi:uncharacterized cofD-like protein